MNPTSPLGTHSVKLAHHHDEFMGRIYRNTDLFLNAGPTVGQAATLDAALSAAREGSIGAHKGALAIIRSSTGDGFTLSQVHQTGSFTFQHQDPQDLDGDFHVEARGVPNWGTFKEGSSVDPVWYDRSTTANPALVGIVDGETVFHIAGGKAQKGLLGQ